KWSAQRERKRAGAETLASHAKGKVESCRGSRSLLVRGGSEVARSRECRIHGGAPLCGRTDGRTDGQTGERASAAWPPYRAEESPTASSLRRLGVLVLSMTFPFLSVISTATSVSTAMPLASPVHLILPSIDSR